MVLETTEREQLTRSIGSSGITASGVGLGTWAIGGWMWGGTDEKASIAAIQAAIDEGVTLIDTAPAYGHGTAERIVARALEGRRGQVVLATKCGLVWNTPKGNHFFDYEGEPVHRYLGPESVVAEVEQSLKRLNTDVIDHYITHWQDPTTPIADTMEALERLKTAGKIRSIGASNTSVDDLRAYIAAGQLDAIQEEYSMVKRGIEATHLPVCAEHGVATLSYSSLALGFLSGRIGPERKFRGDDHRKDNPLFSVGNRARAADFATAIRPVADRHDASTAQIVIAWTLHQPGITFALCGARNPEQAIENARAGRIRLSEEDLQAIDSAADRFLGDLDR